MYHCNEIVNLAFQSEENLIKWIRCYPFKGGMARDFSMGLLEWRPAKNKIVKNLRLEGEAEFRKYFFTRYANVAIEMLPLGNISYITIMAS